MSRLFSPIRVGELSLNHRIVMAPLTRFRASAAHVHGALAAEYYSQRASVPGTLLISEATFISSRASGYNHAPGIYNAAQIAGWRQVTEAVHAQGGYIFCQLWALGRVARPDIVNREAGPDSFAGASATPTEGGVVPRELTEEEIWGFVDDYAQAARNAIEAGFDGVEIHGANVIHSVLLVTIRTFKFKGSTTETC